MLMEIGDNQLRGQQASGETPETGSGRRLDLAAQTLRDEVVARWGREVLAGDGLGFDDEAVCESHRLDPEGVDHALDLRVDFEGTGLGLSVEDGMWLAEYLRGVGWRTGRFSSLIHRGQIAGAFSGWRWGRYRGPGATMDRIHLSVCEVHSGEASLLDPEIFDSTKPWGIRAA